MLRGRFFNDFFSDLFSSVTQDGFIIGAVPTKAKPQLIYDPSRNNLSFDPDGTGSALAKDVSDIGFTIDTLVIGDKATTASPQVIYDTTGGRLSVDMDGTGVGAAVDIATVDISTFLSKALERIFTHDDHGYHDGHGYHGHEWHDHELSDSCEGDRAVIRGTSGDDSLTGTTGADKIRGWTGNDTINGLGGDDRIKGGDGNDRLDGGAGSDWLDGGAGSDALTGYDGQDRFIFKSALVQNEIDIINDFNVSDDTIVLSDNIFTAFLSTGAMSADAFYSAAGASAAQTDKQFIFFNQTTGGLFYDADANGSASSPLQFATLAPSGLSGILTAADFAIT